MKVTRLFFEKTDVVPNDTGTELKVCCKSFDVVMTEDFHKFIESGESWAISLRRGCTNDSYVASVNNCSTNTIIHVRMNEIEFTIPCEESDFVGKLGTNYCKIIVRGML